MSRLVAPVDGRSGTDFASVSCLTAGGCLAVGSIDRDGFAVPLVERSVGR